MNREIKFRAWDKEEKKMFYDVQNAYDSEPVWYGGFGEFLGDQSYEVMQYTGLKDKNGKEIYEGDIVKAIISGGTTKVEYVNDLAGFNPWANSIVYAGRQSFINPSEEIEVIGNIYSNPELLKEGHE